MLALLNNFVAPYNNFVVDLQTKRSYLLIEKCGTQTLRKLTATYPNRFVQMSLQEFHRNGYNKVTVFVREPIDRYISGIFTQMKLYKIPQSVFEHLLMTRRLVPIFDTHTMPQFWFLLRFGIDSDLKFEIVDLQKLDSLTDSKIKINETKNKKILLDQEILDKINYAMTEDIVLYNQFLGKTVTLKEVCNQIANEIDYFKELTSYKIFYT